MKKETETLTDARPQIGDTRIKVQRTGRWKWHAIGERYSKRFERPDDWEAITDYRIGWKTGAFRWWVIFRARLAAKIALDREEQERIERERYTSTEYVDV